MGLAILDYYAERPARVDGTLPPARYILRREEKVVELDNLGQLVGAVRELGSGGMEVKRFKGLGEMNANELWETTMDPQRRGLLKVVISNEADDPEQLEVDAREADRIFSILMGDNVEARRHFIETNAAHVKNLDI
jgi:DNA gyrase subunit B